MADLKPGGNDIFKETMQTLLLLSGSKINPKAKSRTEIRNFEFEEEEKESNYSDLSSSVNNSLRNTPKSIIKRTESTPLMIRKISNLSEIATSEKESFESAAENKSIRNRVVKHSTNYEVNMAKRDEEIQILKEENSVLRKENTKVIEEFNRLKEIQIYFETQNQAKENEIMSLNWEKEEKQNMSKEIEQLVIENQRLMGEIELNAKEISGMRQKIENKGINTMVKGECCIKIQAHTGKIEELHRELEKMNEEVKGTKELLVKEKIGSANYQMEKDSISIELKNANEIIKNLELQGNIKGNEQITKLCEDLRGETMKKDKALQELSKISDELEKVRIEYNMKIMTEQKEKEEILLQLKKEIEKSADFAEQIRRIESEYEKKIENLIQTHHKERDLADLTQSQKFDQQSLEKADLQIKIQELSSENQELSVKHSENVLNLSIVSEESSKFHKLLDSEQYKNKETTENFSKLMKDHQDAIEKKDAEYGEIIENLQKSNAEKTELSEIISVQKGNLVYYENEIFKLKGTIESLESNLSSKGQIFNIAIEEGKKNENYLKNTINDLHLQIKNLQSALENSTENSLISGKKFSESLELEKQKSLREQTNYFNEIDFLNKKIAQVTEELISAQDAKILLGTELAKALQSSYKQDSEQFSHEKELEKFLQIIEKQEFEIKELQEFNSFLLKSKKSDQSPKKNTMLEVLEIENLTVKNENEYLLCKGKLKDRTITAVSKHLITNEKKNNRFIQALKNLHQLAKRQNQAKLRYLDAREKKLVESYHNFAEVLREIERNTYENSFKDSRFLMFLIITVILGVFLLIGYNKIIQG